MQAPRYDDHQLTTSESLASTQQYIHANIQYYRHTVSLWLIGTVRAQPETVISRAWVQSPDPAE